MSKWCTTLGWILALAVEASATPAPSSVRAFGLVIGTNVSRDAEVKSLRYADDDAIQNAKLLGELGATVVLLVDPDHESRAMFADLASTPPTGAAVEAAIHELNLLMDQARAAGATPVFYLFYSGHGDVENNEGYVNLHDRKLRRTDLLELLRGSRAERNHVIVDACQSYFLLFSRGAGGSRSAIVTPVLDEEESIPANTGVLLSTSAAADSHEWEAFQGGIFSHELRSAIRGAADVDLDGRLTYDEAAAFVWSANDAIPNPKFRPRFFSRPPEDSDPLDALLFQLSAGSSDRLVVGPGADEHIYLEDDRGLRLADLRPTAEQRVELRLPRRRPLFVRRVDSNEEVELPAGERLQLAMLPAANASVLTRGAEHVAFRKLFERPFGPETLAAYRARPPEVVDEQLPPTDWTWLRRGIGIGAIGAGIAGGVLNAMAANERDSVGSQTSGVQRHQVNERIDRFNAGAVVLYAVAGAAAATYLAWTLWPDAEVQVEIMPSTQPAARLSVRF